MKRLLLQSVETTAGGGSPPLMQIRPLATQRTSELTALVHREVFDEFPGNNPTEGDLHRWREFRAAYHRAQQLDIWPPFPLQIDFELNSTCNFKCVFCVHGQEDVEKRVLTLDGFEKIIDEGEKNGLCSIKMNYINEPLMSRDLITAIRYAKAHGVLNVYFATNGLLLNVEMSRALIDVGVSKIMISLDAATSETFQVMRSSDKYDRVVANIRRFLGIRNGLGLRYPSVRVNFLRSRLNHHETQDFIGQWDGVADSIGLQTQVGLPSIDDEVFQSNGHYGGGFRCSFPYKLVVIDSGGNILPCCTFSGKKMPLGHIATMSVKQAWQGLQMTALKKLHERGGYAENPICRHCIHGVS